MLWVISLAAPCCARVPSAGSAFSTLRHPALNMTLSTRPRGGSEATCLLASQMSWPSSCSSAKSSARNMLQSSNPDPPSTNFQLRSIPPSFATVLSSNNPHIQIRPLHSNFTPPASVAPTALSVHSYDLLESHRRCIKPSEK